MNGFNVVLAPDDNGTFMVSCPSLPMLLTFGEDHAGALRHAVDALETVLASMIDDGEEIPEGPGKGTDLVMPPLLTDLKVSLYRALRRSGITRAELARRLKWNRESVDRLFRIDHASRVPQIEAALAALGQRAEVRLHEAA